MEKKKNPQNARILSKYKDFLTEEEKYFLENDALVRPRYRTSKPVGKNEDGSLNYASSYAPEWKETSYNKGVNDKDAGAGRGFVNPKNAKEEAPKAMKKGGSVRGVGIAKRGFGCGGKVKMR